MAKGQMRSNKEKKKPKADKNLKKGGAAPSRGVLAFGDPRIDRVLGGGLPLGRWHEAAGEGRRPARARMSTARLAPPAQAPYPGGPARGTSRGS